MVVSSDIEGIQDPQDVHNNGSGNGSETSSWWNRTRSLPSSLNKRKNIFFQVIEENVYNLIFVSLITEDV